MYHKTCWSTWSPRAQTGFAARKDSRGWNGRKRYHAATAPGETFISSYDTPSGTVRGGAGSGAGSGAGGRDRGAAPGGLTRRWADPSPGKPSGDARLGVIMVVPSWGQRCGVAEYTRFLVDELRGQGFAAEVTRGQEDEVRNLVCLGSFCVAHVQFEYQLFKPPGLRHLIRQLKARGLSVIATIHDFLPGQVAANRLIRDEFDAVIVHSARLREELARIGVPLERIHVIPMGCPRVVLGDEGATRAALGVGPGPAIGYFGFALPQKGIIELAVAAKALRETVYPHLKVFAFAAPAFFGTGYAAEVAACLAGVGLTDGLVLRTEYLPVQDVANALHAMDINVLPYKEMAYVGTSSAVRVLMSAEKPIITTDIPYFDDLDGEVYKIPSADPAHIAEAVLCLMANPAKREDMVYRIRRYVEANSWTRIAGRHARLYERLAAAASSAHQRDPGLHVRDKTDYPQAEAWMEAAADAAWIGDGKLRVAAVPDEVWRRVVRRFGKRG